jgi:hypothetical protein
MGCLVTYRGRRPGEDDSGRPWSADDLCSKHFGARASTGESQAPPDERAFRQFIIERSHEPVPGQGLNGPCLEIPFLFSIKDKFVLDWEWVSG